MRYDVSNQGYWKARNITRRTGRVVEVFPDGINVDFQDGAEPHENGTEFFGFDDLRYGRLEVIIK